jgi:hypothetical protein
MNSLVNNKLIHQFMISLVINENKKRLMNFLRPKVILSFDHSFVGIYQFMVLKLSWLFLKKKRRIFILW